MGERINYIKEMTMNNENEKALIRLEYEIGAVMDRKNGIEDVCIQCHENLFEMENKIDEAAEEYCKPMVFHEEYYATCKQKFYTDPEFSKDIFEEMNGEQNQLNKVLNMACHFEKAYNIDQWCWLQSNVETRRRDVEAINMRLDDMMLVDDMGLDRLDDNIGNDRIEAFSALNAAANIGSLGIGAVHEINYHDQVPKDYRLEMIEKKKQNQVEQKDVQDDQNEGLEATCTDCHEQFDLMVSSMNEVDAYCQDTINENEYNLCKKHNFQVIFNNMGGQENDCLKNGSDFFKIAQSKRNNCFESEEHLIWTLGLACHYGNANNIDQWCLLQSDFTN